ncbi:MAG TPA: S-layer homology domain-containing protein [Chloroflexia bacterium]
MAPMATCGAGNTPLYNILIVHTESAGAMSMLRGELLAQSNVGGVDVFTATASTPTLAQLQGYDLVVAMSAANGYADAQTLGNNLADYYDGGGIVVPVYASFLPLGGSLLGGRWETGSYSPYTHTTATPGDNPVTLGTYDASSPLMQGVTTLTAEDRIILTLNVGATAVATYTDSSAAIAYKGRAIGMTAYLGNGGNGTTRGTGDYSKVMVNALRWLKPNVCPTYTATSTSTRTATSVPSGTSTSVGGTATPNATATACAIKFADIPPTGEGSTFYGFVRCLACRGIISGYPCGAAGEPCNDDDDPYYRPGANVTRGQLSKIIANSAGLNDDIPEGQQQFADVEPGDPFYPFVERLAQTGAIAGYPCGGPGVTEPCDDEGRPYFRPNNPATRGQISKIVSIAAEFDEEIPEDQQQFTDVDQDSPFWVYIERLAGRGVISGYGDASKCPTGTPCFRYNDQTTRGQMAKIAANAFFPDCDTPARR